MNDTTTLLRGRCVRPGAVVALAMILILGVTLSANAFTQIPVNNWGLDEVPTGSQDYCLHG